jgi:hypothetical protein
MKTRDRIRNAKPAVRVSGTPHCHVFFSVKDFVHLLCRTSFRYIGQLIQVLYPASAMVRARRAGPQHRFMRAHARASEGR